MDRKTSKVELKVLCLGLPRCGTTSLTAALESDIIGIQPVLHAADTARDKKRCRMILDAFRLQGSVNVVQRHARLQEIIDGHAASAESLNAFADDLLDLYPQAKVILNVRSPPLNGEPAGVEWARSCHDAISFFGSNWPLLLCWPLRQYRFWWRRYRLQTDILVRKGLLPGGRDRLLAPKGCAWMTAELYDRYIEWVHHEAKNRDRKVLMWYPGMGWQPLCEFLERDVPFIETPLPHLNDRSAASVVNSRCMKRGLRAHFILVSVMMISWWIITWSSALQETRVAL